MPKASIVIRVSDKGITYEGNEEIVWFLNERNKVKILTEILKTLREYKRIKRRKGKMRVVLIGIKEEDKTILRDFEEDFAFIFEESYQTKIINFLK